MMTKSKETDCLFFNITTFGSDKAFVREAYKDGAAALFHLKNMGHMIPKLFEVADINVQVHGPAKEIEPLKAILEDADFYEAISGFWFRLYLLKVDRQGLLGPFLFGNSK